MRMIATFVAAVTILTVSYFIAYGLPDRFSFSSASETSAANTNESAPRMGPPGQRRGGANVTTVVLTPLELKPYVNVLRAVGSARALHSAEVIANASGEVTKVNLAANQQVSAGDVLVQLDAETETFNLEIAQTELDQARETVQRYERLSGSGSSTITDVTLSDARAAQRLAQANVGLAQIALDDRTIRSPISGRLGLSDIEVGDVLSADSSVVTIDDAEALLIEFELPERSVGMLSTQQTVLANTPSFVGRAFEGEIVSFDSRIDSVTRSVTVKARIENPDGMLWPGMTFAVRIIDESAPLAALPSTAISWSRLGPSIWIDSDGVAEAVPTTILFRRNELVWISADLPVGTMVVTEGVQKLRTGSRIVAADAGVERPNSNGDNERPNPALGQAEPTPPAAVKEPT